MRCQIYECGTIRDSNRRAELNIKTFFSVLITLQIHVKYTRRNRNLRYQKPIFLAKLVSQNLLFKSRLFICLVLVAISMPAVAGDWPTWRGPNQDGTSAETGLISTWSVEGENLLWEAEFIGRSTPIILNGRVYVMGRVGKDITEQERVACFDAETGELIWNYQFNVFHTTITFNRVGWTNLAGDPETGNIYAHGVQGLFFCFDKDGNILWSRSLTEEYGRISGLSLIHI